MSPSLQNLRTTLFLLLITLFLSACDINSDGGPSGYSVQVNITDADANTKTISQDITLKLSGVKLQDKDKNSLNGSVILPAGSAKTIIIYLKDAPVVNQDLKLTTKATGYIDSGASVVFSTDQKLYEINLGLVKDQAGKVAKGVFAVKEDITAKVSAAGKVTQAIVVNNKDAGNPGVKITIPKDTVMTDKDGNPVKGVKLSITNFDPEEQEALAAYPGGLNVMAEATGFNIGGQPQVGDQAINFKSAGFAAISLVDAAGNKVKNFSQPVEVAMQFKIGTKDGDGKIVQLGNKVPIWSYDEDTGKWGYEKEGTVEEGIPGDGLYDVVYTVTHLSYWNLDWHYFGGVCAPRFNIVDTDGNPILSSALGFHIVIDSSPSVDSWVRYYENDGFVDLYNAPSGYEGKFEVWDHRRFTLYKTITFTSLCEQNNPSKGKVFTVVVDGLPTQQQTINAGADIVKVVGDPVFRRVATGFVGTGAVIYQVIDTNVATVNANTGDVTVLSAGETDVLVTIVGDSTYLSTDDTYRLTVLPTSESVDAGGDVTKNFVDANFTQAAIIPGGGDSPLYSSSNASVAIVNAGTGEVTIKGAGVAVISVSVAANSHHVASEDSYTLTVNKSAQTIEAGNNVTKTYLDNSYTQAATNILGDLTPSYSSSNTDVATVDASGQVVIKVSGSTDITATTAGTANFIAGSDSYTLTVEKAVRTINAGADLAKVTNSPAFTQTPVASPALGAIVSFVSSDTNVATVDSFGTVTLTGRVGEIEITANVAETANYLGASDFYSIAVNIDLTRAEDDTKVNLSWSAVTNATAYKVYYATQTTSNIDLINIATLPGGTTVGSIVGTTQSIAGLTNGIQYYFVVTAVVNGVEKGRSNEVSGTPVEIIVKNLNDTGMAVSTSGDPRVENNSTCESSLDNKYTEQDCFHGRDALAENGNLIKIGGGSAGFDYTKLDVSGQDIISQFNSWDDNGSEEGSGTRWSCVKDNHTGLVWEVKNNDGTAPVGDGNTPSVDNIHHANNVYQWGGVSAMGRNHQSKEGIYFDGWNNLITETNTENMCGFSDWRVPTINELMSIVHHGKVNPSIDDVDVAEGGISAFPNTAIESVYWTASPYVADALNAWTVNFGSSFGYEVHPDVLRASYAGVRLVRSEPSN